MATGSGVCDGGIDGRRKKGSGEREIEWIRLDCVHVQRSPGGAMKHEGGGRFEGDGLGLGGSSVGRCGRPSWAGLVGVLRGQQCRLSLSLSLICFNRKTNKEKKKIKRGLGKEYFRK